MSYLRKSDPDIFRVIKDETIREEETLELIASENFVSPAVLEAQGSVLTNKYAEGYPAKRWYGGCKYIDMAEEIAVERAKKIFGAEHVNVQPHSGSQANMAVYFALLKLGETVMALDLACGGHLTHGHPHNFSGMFFKIVPYGVSKKDERLDYDEILRLAKQHKPKMILAGACAYPRAIDFKKFREICDAVGAYLFVDMAHIAGLVAAGLHQSPLPYADVVTTTTHKTLRGPRGGMILSRLKYSKALDSIIFPGIQGGPLMHVIAAKAVAFGEMLKPGFKEYQAQIIKNAKALADGLAKKGYRIVAQGTDNHLLLVDLSNKNISGKDAAEALDKARITVNKNLIPYDKKPPSVTSGIRLGTPAITTRGMKEPQILQIAGLIDKVLQNPLDNKNIMQVGREVSDLTLKFPLYKDKIKEMQT
jgi:glycine hydroxymethyltransferase